MDFCWLMPVSAFSKFGLLSDKECVERAVVVVQLPEQSLPIPENRSSNPAIANFYSTYLLLTVCRKDEITEKEAGNGPFTKECAEIVRIVYVCN